jgi:hypothetical protein
LSSRRFFDTVFVTVSANQITPFSVKLTPLQKFFQKFFQTSKARFVTSEVQTWFAKGHVFGLRRDTQIAATMPRRSDRQLVLRLYKRFLEKRLKERLLRHAVGAEDDIQDDIDAIVQVQYNKLMSKRYFFRGKYRKADHAAFCNDKA